MHDCVQEGKEYAKENDLLFMETSAKAGTNICELFNALGTFEHSCHSPGPMLLGGCV
jgi:hypothetical protein